VTIKRDPPPDAKEYEGVPDKFEKFFSPEPGEGD
jgi:ferredoxin